MVHIYKKKKFILFSGTIFLSFLIFLTPSSLFAQQKDSLSWKGQGTLQDCIAYAWQHNPDMKNAKLQEDITASQIKGKLADWYPQLQFDYSLQHNFQLPSFYSNGSILRNGTNNVSGANFSVTQNIFNRDALLASKSSKEVQLATRQNTAQQRIELAVSVSKAFYDLILTLQQIKVIDADIQRTKQSLQDAMYQYQSGLVDKTDYKRATIALNNATAQKKAGEAALAAKTVYIKSLMGLEASDSFQPVYDTLQMEQEISLDTTRQLQYDRRIEMQQLVTQKKLLQYNLQYNKWSFLPSVSAFGNYNLNFFNDQFSKLYSAAYPNSFAGLRLSFPLFQGGKRTEQIRQAELNIDLVDNSIIRLQQNMQSQYATALAGYKSNLYFFLSQKENLALASEVYDVIRLQYRSGVKTYLDVITAETDLRTAQINYYNTLYELLSSKIDVEQALGNILY